MYRQLDLHILTEDSYKVPSSYASDDGIGNILIKFDNHLSMKKIKQNFNITCKFLFQPVFIYDVKQVIKDCKSKKSVDRDVLIHIL